MTGVILVTHDGLGEALCREAETILGHPLSVVTVSVSYRAQVETTLDDLRTALAAGADRHGVLVLTDLPGATPHNLAGRVAAEHQVPLVSGLNLPMLLKVINHADKLPLELAELAASGGQQGIVKA